MLIAFLAFLIHFVQLLNGLVCVIWCLFLPVVCVLLDGQVCLLFQRREKLYFWLWSIPYLHLNNSLVVDLLDLINDEVCLFLA